MDHNSSRMLQFYSRIRLVQQRFGDKVEEDKVEADKVEATELKKTELKTDEVEDRQN
jgi:hypothetical protein